MIVPRSSTAVDVPIEETGHHWADLVRQRLSEVEETYRRPVAHLDRYRDFAESR